MCGICGIAGDAGRQDRSAIVRRMADAMAHRGPDDSGVEAAPSGAAELGFRRLSIIDLAGGHQPMTNEDGTILLVFNGEIYNFQGLREDLVRGGHRFRTRSDTEVILHLYEEKGTDCVAELQGMFGFAIWDDRERTLLLARDRLGKKPVSYWHDGDRLVFGSEIKAILQHPDVERKFNPEALPYYLSFLYVPAPLTMFRGIQKLPPGHWLKFREGRVEVQRYWEPKIAPAPMSEEEAADAIYATVSRAVERRLVSDVPLGAFLSGGIDSSIVVGLMSHHRREPVKTFSIGFEERSYDELEYARAAAKHFRTDHKEFTVRPDALEVLPKLVWHYDEPFADSSAVPTYYVSLKTAEHVKVALSGDGGDECFGGYRRYAAMRRLAQLKRVPRIGTYGYAFVSGLLGILRPTRTLDRIRRLLSVMDRPMSDLYLELVSFYRTEEHESLLSNGTGGAAAANHIREPYNRHDVDAVNAASYADLMTYLPGDILAKVDIASMACALEVRCPFLDTEVLDLAFRLPGSLKVTGKAMKVALKRAFRGLLPPPVQARGKMGFGMPVREWFRGPLRPLVAGVILSKQARDRGLFRSSELARIAEEHQAGKHDYGHHLWILLCLELWFRSYIDPKVPEPVMLGG